MMISEDTLFEENGEELKDVSGKRGDHEEIAKNDDPTRPHSPRKNSNGANSQPPGNVDTKKKQLAKQQSQIVRLVGDGPIQYALIGNPGVGKTTFVHRFQQLDFQETSVTQGLNNQKLNIGTQKRELYDIGGSKLMETFVPGYVEKCSLILIVLSVFEDDIVKSSEDLEKELTKWAQCARNGNKQAPIFIVFNKMDMLDDTRDLKKYSDIAEAFSNSKHSLSTHTFYASAAKNVIVGSDEAATTEFKPEKPNYQNDSFAKLITGTHNALVEEGKKLQKEIDEKTAPNKYQLIDDTCKQVADFMRPKKKLGHKKCEVLNELVKKLKAVRLPQPEQGQYTFIRSLFQMQLSNPMSTFNATLNESERGSKAFKEGLRDCKNIALDKMCAFLVQETKDLGADQNKPQKMKRLIEFIREAQGYWLFQANVNTFRLRQSMVSTSSVDTLGIWKKAIHNTTHSDPELKKRKELHPDQSYLPEAESAKSNLSRLNNA